MIRKIFSKLVNAIGIFYIVMGVLSAIVGVTMDSDRKSMMIAAVCMIVFGIPHILVAKWIMPKENKYVEQVFESGIEEVIEEALKGTYHAAMAGQDAPAAPPKEVLVVCPGCGASVSVFEESSAECEYCGSMVKA